MDHDGDGALCDRARRSFSVGTTESVRVERSRDTAPPTANDRHLHSARRARVPDAPPCPPPPPPSIASRRSTTPPRCARRPPLLPPRPPPSARPRPPLNAPPPPPPQPP